MSAEPHLILPQSPVRTQAVLCSLLSAAPLRQPFCSRWTEMNRGMKEGQAEPSCHCPCICLLVHHPHKHGTTQQSPSCSLPAWSAKTLEHWNHLFTKREAQREHGIATLSSCNSSHLHHILALCAIHRAQTLWMATNFYYSSDPRRLQTMQAWAADSIMCSCKLRNTEEIRVDPQHGWFTFQSRAAPHMHRTSPSRDSLGGRSSSQF